MAVDQQRRAVVVLILVMAAQVYLSDLVERESIDLAGRRKAKVGGGNKDVVHIQKQPAAGAATDLRKEVRLGPVAFGEGQVA